MGLNMTQPDKLYSIDTLEKMLLRDTCWYLSKRILAKQLADTMRELETAKSQIMEDQLCNKEVVDSLMRELAVRNSEVEFLDEKLKEAMRENEKLKESLAFYEDPLKYNGIKEDWPNTRNAIRNFDDGALAAIAVDSSKHRLDSEK
jgi:predicted nuclease with TOPRIM domain